MPIKKKKAHKGKKPKREKAVKKSSFRVGRGARIPAVSEHPPLGNIHAFSQIQALQRQLQNEQQNREIERVNILAAQRKIAEEQKLRNDQEREETQIHIENLRRGILPPRSSLATRQKRENEARIEALREELGHDTFENVINGYPQYSNMLSQTNEQARWLGNALNVTDQTISTIRDLAQNEPKWLEAYNELERWQAGAKSNRLQYYNTFLHINNLAVEENLKRQAASEQEGLELRFLRNHNEVEKIFLTQREIDQHQASQAQAPYHQEYNPPNVSFHSNDADITSNISENEPNWGYQFNENDMQDHVPPPDSIRINQMPPLNQGISPNNGQNPSPEEANYQPFGNLVQSNQRISPLPPESTENSVVSSGFSEASESEPNNALVFPPINDSAAIAMQHIVLSDRSLMAMTPVEGVEQRNDSLMAMTPVEGLEQRNNSLIVPSSATKRNLSPSIYAQVPSNKKKRDNEPFIV